MTCKNCGKEFEGKFCPDCGTAVEKPPLTVCPNCSAKRVDNSKFCTNCGYNFQDQTLKDDASRKKTQQKINLISPKLKSVLCKVYIWLLAGGMLIVGIVSLLCLTAPTLYEEFFGVANNLSTGFAALKGGIEVDVPASVVNVCRTLLALSLFCIVYGCVQLIVTVKRPYRTYKNYCLWVLDGAISITLIVLGGIVSTVAQSEEFMGAKLGAGFVICIIIGVFGIIFLAARIFYELKIFNWADTGIKHINPSTFKNCRGLKSFKLPTSVTHIGDNSFSNCRKLTDISLPDGLIIIGNKAFYGCESLTEIIIPHSVTKIGDCAFKNCSCLSNIKIPNSVTHIGNEAFNYTDWYNNQPNGLVYIGKVVYKFKGDMRENISITLNDDIKGIADSAFSGCYRLTGINLPDELKIIGNFAFRNCTELTNISIGNSLKSIGMYAFSGCGKLTNIIIPKVTTSIKMYAFEYCNNLTNLTIGSELKSIGDYAFYNCSKLTTINFKGTKAQWKAIKKGLNWNIHTGNYTVFCEDGNISKLQSWNTPTLNS